MAIDYVDVSDNHRCISLSGRLDTTGTAEIALKFTSLSTTAKRRVVVDLTAVTFLASVGIREIISNAKALGQRGGKLVLFVGNNSIVSKTLETTGIDTLIPMFDDMAEAERAALS